MAWKFNNEAPIFLQIMDVIKLRIARGELKPGDKVPPVRELAIEAGVNPNTMQKALSELEREGVLQSERTIGRFVTKTDTDYAKDISTNYNSDYVSKMRALGYSDEQIIKSLTAYLKEGDKNE